jgi:hypothetical protein
VIEALRRREPIMPNANRWADQRQLGGLILPAWQSIESCD